MVYINSYDIITCNGIKDALQKSHGPDYKLISFHIKDFTKKGDNYASFVTSVVVNVRKGENGKEEEMCYIVKLNPCRNNPWDIIASTLFRREGVCFTQIGPDLSKILINAGQARLKMPKCFYSSFKTGREILINEDLRKDGFQLLDRKKGMDLKHTLLVIKELARMHAASYVAEQQSSRNLEDIYTIFQTPMHGKDSMIFKVLTAAIKQQIQNTIELLKELQILDKGIKILEVLKNNYADILFSQVQNTPKFFKSLNHGDIWNNNCLFR